jgi:hypothetical protein
LGDSLARFLKIAKADQFFPHLMFSINLDKKLVGLCRYWAIFSQISQTFFGLAVY